MSAFTRTQLQMLLRLATLLVSVAVLVLGASVATAQPTPTINYQGKLTDSTGQAVPDGSYNLRFYLYNTTGGATTTNIWTEELTGSNQVTVTNGLFSVMLGSTTPFTNVDFNQPLYLGVEVGATGTPAWDGEMTPRKTLGTVPAAFQAERASTSALFDGLATTSFLRSDQPDSMDAFLTLTSGASTSDLIVSGTATTTNLAVGSDFISDLTGAGLTVTGNALTVASTSLGLGDGTLGGLTDVTLTAPADGQLLSYSGGTWVELATSSLNIALSDTTGTLGVTRGGTGATSFTSNELLLGSGTGALTTVSAGSDGEILSLSGGVPTWSATSSLGLGDGTFLGLSDTPGSFTSNRLLYTNAAGDALTDSADLTFDASTLTVGADIDITGGTNGIAFGGTRMFYASTTLDNIAIGEGAGENMVDNGNSGDNFNVFLGFEAGQNASSTGSGGNQNNNFFGYRAGHFNTGSDNNLLGTNAGHNNIGSDNNLFGFDAGFNNTGSNNNLLGNSAGRDNTGSFNNLFGASAGFNNTGSSNNIFGFEAGYLNQGSFNTFIGSAAGAYANTGSYNDFIGFNAGTQLNATATVLIGSETFAGNSLTAINNTALGYRAGYSAQTGADNNLLLGYRAADSLTTGANNLIIGYDVEAPSNTADGQLNIGNAIFGTGLTATGTDIFTGGLAIGTSSANSARLSIQSESTTDILNLFETGGEEVFTVLENGNIGIGDTSPNQKLSVLNGSDNSNIAFIWGADTSSQYVGFGVSGANGIITGGGAGSTNAGLLFRTADAGTEADQMAILPNGRVGVGITSSFDARLTVQSQSTEDILNLLETGGTEVFTVLENGNVGVGTSSPSALLSLDTSAASLDGAGAAGLDQYLLTENTVDGAVQYGNRFFLNASNTATTTIVGSIYRVADDTTFGNTVRGLEVQANRGGNTQGENTALSGFARTFGVRGFTSADAGGSFEPAGGFFETGGTSQGNAIRGFSETITTASLLSLFQSSSTFAGTGLSMNFGNGGGSFSSSTSKYLDFQNAGTSVFTVSAFGTTTIGDGTMSNMAGLQIGYGGLCVDNDGTCTASTTGQIASVSNYTGNSDLAEMYFSSDALVPGEVVTLRGELSIDRADQTSNRPVLGVVSTKPGVVMGADDTSTRAGEEAFPVALSGRVPVRLSTENGPIKTGDELMLSSIPGVAMKATGTGRVIGIALEDFDDTRMYSETYLNQFGDDMVDPQYEPISINNDPRLNDGCYQGGGGAAGEETPCVPLTATTTEGQVAEANALAAQESVAEQLAELAATPSERAQLVDGTTVRVGQVVMFVDLSYRWLDDRQQAALATLLGTSTAAAAADEEKRTILDRLVTLARNFVDGVLTLTGLKAERVETKELCVDGVCVTGDELRTLLDAVDTTDTTTSDPTMDDAEGDTTNTTTNSDTNDTTPDEVDSDEADVDTEAADTTGASTTEQTGAPAKDVGDTASTSVGAGAGADTATASSAEAPTAPANDATTTSTNLSANPDASAATSESDDPEDGTEMSETATTATETPTDEGVESESAAGADDNPAVTEGESNDTNQTEPVELESTPAPAAAAEATVKLEASGSVSPDQTETE